MLKRLLNNTNHFLRKKTWKQSIFVILAGIFVVCVIALTVYLLTFLAGKFNIVLGEEAKPSSPQTFDFQTFESVNLIKK